MIKYTPFIQKSILNIDIIITASKLYGYQRQKVDYISRGLDLNQHDWKKILYILSENIKTRVINVIPQRGKLPYIKFKNLLDKQAQDVIIETLRNYKINGKLISEEGDELFGNEDYYIIADPIDGTTNLSRGLQPSVLSLSVATAPFQNSVIAGIVSNFYTNETYYAEKDKGAWLNEFLIKPAPYITYQEGLIGLELSKNPKLEKMHNLIIKSKHIREEGCSAASLCHVADGSLDAHIDLRDIVRATDISSGLFIIREAGGVFSINDELFGDLPLTRETRCNIITANSKKLHDEIKNLIDEK